MFLQIYVFGYDMSWIYMLDGIPVNFRILFIQTFTPMVTSPAGLFFGGGRKPEKTHKDTGRMYTETPRTL